MGLFEPMVYIRQNVLSTVRYFIMKLYHITPRKNLESIVEKGLIPGYHRGLGKGCGVIFLTDNPKYILETQAGPNWISQFDLVILEIDIEECTIKPYIPL